MSEHEPNIPSPRDAFRDCPAWMPGTRPGMTTERELKLTRVRSSALAGGRRAEAGAFDRKPLCPERMSRDVAQPAQPPVDGAMRLCVENLSVSRGGRMVLDRLSFSLSSGQALVVTGPNGAGKSTLLRALAGLLPRAGGSVGLSGGPPEAELPQQAHYLAHSDGMKAALTVQENLDFWSRLSRANARPAQPHGRGRARGRGP